ENARSRVYLGVHFQFDADGGLQMGGNIGRWVVAQEFGTVSYDFTPVCPHAGTSSTTLRCPPPID
ncbi:hypothetical protein, partial [Antribacter gilvus]|uniref:hypothetical protein n=1 Tax=Antribacter gilvus TaxID=2304675 RepID=UPI00198157C6